MGNPRFETLFSQALRAGQKRDYRKAITILEDLAARGVADGNTTKTGTAHPEIYLYLARAWHAEKMYSRAAVCASAYIKRDPDNGSGWFFLGRTYLADGAFERAIIAFRKSIELNPDSIDARTLLGTACLKAKRPILARTVFEEALSLAPDDPRLNQGYQNALFVEAVRTYRRGDAETARQMITFLINNDIDGVVPRLYLAHALHDLGYVKEALGQYEAASMFAPDDTALQWYPVSLLLEMGQTDEAVRRMSTLGEMPTDGPMSQEMVSLVIIKNYLEQQEWTQAVQAAKTFLRIFGSNAQVYALMGEAQRNLGNKTEAINHFRKALDIEKNNPAPWYGILMVFADVKDWTALTVELPRAERAGCDKDIIAYYRILCAANLDEEPEPILVGIQDEVRKYGPTPELVSALARTYYRLGLADLAIGWYRKAIDLESENEGVWVGYITCCEELEAESATGDTQEDEKTREGELKKAYTDYLDRWDDNESVRHDYIRYLAAHEYWEDAADQTEILGAVKSSDQILRQLAWYRRKAGQYRKAAILYRGMLRKKPDDRTLLANLVFCLDNMGETEHALGLLREANRIFSPDAGSLLIEGRLHVKAGDYNTALEVFRKVVDTFPKDVRGWEEVAAVYEKQNVPEMATVFRQKARDIKTK